jgi:hypothetical protein
LGANVNSGFGWFDLVWPWIGLVGAAVLLVVLLATPWLRSDLSRERRQDPTWLGFLAVAAYLVHQVEEYGVALNGVPHAFPDELCGVLGQPAYPACAIPPAFYLAVNLALVWIAAPVAALLARRLPALGLVLWGVIAVNAMVHIAPAVALRRYDAGLLTATVVFLPLALWSLLGVTAKDGPLRRSVLLPVIGAGALMHAVLGGTVLLFLHAGLPAWALITLQPVAVLGGYAVALRSQRRVDAQARANATNAADVLLP